LTTNPGSPTTPAASNREPEATVLDHTAELQELLATRGLRVLRGPNRGAWSGILTATTGSDDAALYQRLIDNDVRCSLRATGGPLLAELLQHLRRSRPSCGHVRMNGAPAQLRHRARRRFGSIRWARFAGDRRRFQHRRLPSLPKAHSRSRCAPRGPVGPSPIEFAQRGRIPVQSRVCAL
jgi:hypothetical protein